MSQAKVDKYKAEKKSRPEDVKKSKAKKTALKVLGIVIVILFIVWVAFSGYKEYQDSQPKVQTEVNMDAIDQFLGND